MRSVRARLLTAVLAGLVAVLPGCAGVPDSSPPQAIGTVDVPAPKQLPEPNPSMSPDQTLREFLKATADPANRHIAARQFLTESASKDWDDQGSALLIDDLVFTETRSDDKVSVTMQADILGSLSDIGVFETGEGKLPDPGPIELVQTPNGWRINRTMSPTPAVWPWAVETATASTDSSTRSSRRDCSYRLLLARGTSPSEVPSPLTSTARTITSRGRGAITSNHFDCNSPTGPSSRSVPTEIPNSSGPPLAVWD